MKHRSTPTACRKGRYLLCLTLGTVVLCGGERMRSAETGDFDGDGRLSTADVVHIRDGLPLAPGSLDAFEAWECFGWWDEFRYPGIVYLESLRRGVAGSLPHWDPLWTVEVIQKPLVPDPRVMVRLGATVDSGGDDRVRLHMTLTNLVRIRAFSLVVESDGDVLRVPFLGSSRFGGWDDWRDIHTLGLHEGGDLPVSVNYPQYLITGGKYVVTYALDRSGRVGYWGPIEPGEYSIETEARLPKGTAAGGYGLRLHPASEIVLDDGLRTVVAPTVESDGSLTLLEDITEGWDGGIPPLQFDTAEQRIGGQVEFRATEAEGLPGETVSIRVSMRTEVPTNLVFFRLEWPRGTFRCAESEPAKVLYTNPEDGERYVSYLKGEHDGGFVSGYTRCNTLSPTQGPFHEGQFRMRESYPDRPLEYFKPLDEWVDLTELRVIIPDDAEGGTEIPLTFRRFELNQPAGLPPWPRPFYQVYDYEFPCPDEFQPGYFNWTYDEIVYQDTKVTVLGDQGPPGDTEPLDLGIEVVLGSVVADPGELVKLPIFASKSSDTPLSLFRLVFEVDPEAVSVEGLEVDLLSLVSGEIVEESILPGGFLEFEECDEEDPLDCTHGIPGVTYFHTTEAHFAVIDQLTSFEEGAESVPYPAESLAEIGRLVLRVREEFSGSETVVRPSTLPQGGGMFDTEVESGGFLLPPETATFAPTTTARGGVIGIAGRTFSRGDANVDGNTDLGDAVGTLNFLFLGGVVPACMDAADSDDSGVVEITDPILLLGALFLGEGTLAAPFPGCGADETFDELGCREAGCADA